MATKKADEGKKNVVWSTKRVDDWLKDYADGYTRKENPWLDGAIGVRRANLIYEYTPEEIEEITKCAKDVIYFANTYCYCMQGSKGYQPLTLRDYQVEVLRSYSDNRFTINLAARQCGKCSIDSELCLKQNNEIIDKHIEDIYFERNKSLFSKTKYFLMKAYRKLKSKEILKKIILYLIERIERFEYRNMNLDEYDISKKIIDSIDISDENIQVLSHDGYHTVTHVHKTQPYTIYELVLDSGDRLMCADNHIVFCEGFEQKFVKDLTSSDFVMTKNGISRVAAVRKTDHKVSMYDITVDSEDHSYYTNDILSHNTVIAAVFLLHNTIFNVDRNVGIAANKLVTAVEIMDKIREMMDHLPFFLKPGIKVNNQQKMFFDNGCSITAQATTEKSFIGFTIHTLYLDEFAHVEPHILESFYENVMPTVSSMEDSKIIITSTPNGYNLFQRLYEDAVEGRNSYHPVRVDWWQVPGRDDAWREKMVHDCGGEEEFMRQYGNSFLSTGNTLLSPESLAKIQRNRVRYVKRDLIELERNWEDEYVDLLFHPDFNVEDLKNPNKRWVMSLDLSEGGGGDDSVMNLFEMKPKNKELIKKVCDIDQDIKKSDYFQLVQVGRFKSNVTALEKMAKLVYIMTPMIINPDTIRIVCEYNTYGATFMQYLQLVFGEKNEFDMSTILKFAHNTESNVKKYGLKVRNDNKPVLCINLKWLIANDNMIVSDFDTVGQFETFVKVGSTWKAGKDKDDLAMSCVDAGAIFEHPYFDVMMEEILGQDEYEELYNAFTSKMDNQYGNLYDNYENISLSTSDSDWKTSGYFGKKGLYY